MNRSKAKRYFQAPPGSEEKVGTGLRAQSSKRCKATHDVPYTLRCTLNVGHQPLRKHVDKDGREW